MEIRRLTNVNADLKNRTQEQDQKLVSLSATNMELKREGEGKDQKLVKLAAENEYLQQLITKLDRK